MRRELPGRVGRRDQPSRSDNEDRSNEGPDVGPDWEMRRDRLRQHRDHLARRLEAIDIRLEEMEKLVEPSREGEAEEALKPMQEGGRVRPNEPPQRNRGLGPRRRGR